MDNAKQICPTPGLGQRKSGSMEIEQFDVVVVGTGPTLSYTFPTAGEHTVVVTATNGAGSQSFTVPVTVIYDSRILYLPAMHN